jgi:Uma2 family endonuclease
MSLSTQTNDLAPGVDAAIPTDFVYRLSVEQFHQMVRNGILGEDDPIELLDGWLVPKMMKNPEHGVVTELVRRALEQILPTGWHIKAQEPVTLSTSEPEPDVMVVRGQLLDYLHCHPKPGDVALVVEVADTSLERDQTIKKRLYAQAGIPIYWIVNVLEKQLEVYSDPSGPSQPPDYRQRRDYGTSEEVALVLEGREAALLPVRSMLP